MASASTQTSKKAVFSLIFGVFSFCLSVLAGVPAVILGFLSLRDIKNGRGAIAGRGLAIGGLAAGVIGSLLSCVLYIFLGLTLGVTKAKEAASRVTATNNLRQIGLALHTYHERMESFPEGQKNGLSWRVWILPDLGEKALFDQFHTNEPWDSAHNKPLIARMPVVYADPRFPPVAVGHTYFRGIVGPQTVLGDGVHLGIVSNLRGSAYTAVVVEGAEPVPWTKPDEIAYRSGQPIPALGGPKRDQFLVLFADAHVQMLPTDMPAKSINDMFIYVDPDSPGSKSR